MPKNSNGRVKTKRPSISAEKPISALGVQSIAGQEHRFMSIEYDHRAQAQAALLWAVAATCECERLHWMRIAMAWRDLASASEADCRVMLPVNARAASFAHAPST
jgi:hypothetical protein